MTDVYRAPDFNFAQEPGGPSQLLQNGIAGNYSIAAFETINETWIKLKGKKGMLWIGWFLTIAISIGASIALSIVGAGLGFSGGFSSYIHSGIAHNPVSAGAFSVGQNALQMLITLPVQLGFFLYCLKSLVGLPTEVGELFQHYGKTITLFLTVLLMYLLAAIGFMLLILPGIYLLVAYAFANDLVIEKNLGPWEALEASRKAVTHYWWTFFGVYILSFLVMVLAVLPLVFGIIISIHMDLLTKILVIMGGGVAMLVALAWVLPFTVLLKAVLYHKVFGCEGEHVLAEAKEI